MNKNINTIWTEEKNCPSLSVHSAMILKSFIELHATFGHSVFSIAIIVLINNQYKFKILFYMSKCLSLSFAQENVDPKLDDDEDRKNPQYIPKKGTFYEHDDRTMPGEEDDPVL